MSYLVGSSVSGYAALNPEGNFNAAVLVLNHHRIFLVSTSLCGLAIMQTALCLKTHWSFKDTRYELSDYHVNTFLLLVLLLYLHLSRSYFLKCN